MSEESRNKGFINRWSTRKQQAERQEEAAHCVQPLPVQPTNDGDDFPEPSAKHDSPAPMHGSSVLPESIDDEPLLSDIDMPPIESLSADSDVSAFFNKGVSAALRKAALRHVFRQPAYNVRDGLNDYDGDYTVFEPLGDTVTSDMKWHIARKERERLEAEARELEQRRLEAQNEQESQEMEEARAEQDVQAEEEARAEEQAQDEQDLQAEEEAQDEQDSQGEEEAQAGQKAQDLQKPKEPHADHEAESHREFEHARQIDVDQKGDTNTRNKPA